jgi:hypothetical protein
MMRPVAAYDPIAMALAATPRAVVEADVLAEQWALGEDASLRDDPRFRRTPAGRWVLAMHYLANDWLVTALRDQGTAELALTAELITAAKVLGAQVAWCEADPRLRFDGDRVRLAPSELSDAPLLEQVPPLQQYTTHLPVLTLRAAAASEPAGEWGRAAEPQHVEPLGWLRVEPRGRSLHRRMFVARVQGQSMDDGRRGIVDGAWAVFEFVFADGVQYGSGSDEPIVLARGAFDDPEHGTYAVKRWRHDAGEFRLVSLNPDKVRFPDIVVPEVEDVRVVANFERALRPSDYARQPKPARRKGRRAIGDDALAAVTSQLQRRMARFFEAAPAAPGEEEEAPLAPAQVVCLSGEEGGVHVEVGPLSDLEPFVKRVRVSGAGAEHVLLASNLRHRSQRVTVAPEGGPWHCFADGFEDDVDLSSLTCEALSTEGPLVFLVDAGDVGRRVSTTVLAPSQHYRVLVPPALGWASDGVDAVTSLAEGWRLWELPLPALPVGPTSVALTGLGLTVGERAPRLDAGLIAPVAWRRTPAGTEYPVFGAEHPILLRVTGSPTDADGDAAVFVAGPAGAERTALPAGDGAILRLGPLQPGRYAATLMHRRTRVPAASLLFEVGEPDAPVSVEAEVALLGARVTLGAGEVVVVDVPASDSEQLPLEVVAPPSWPVRVSWRDLGVHFLGEERADDERNVDLGAPNQRLADRLARSRLGDVEVDLGELGAVVARYRRPAARIESNLKHLVEERASLVRARPGDWSALLTYWFVPVLETLGYTIDVARPVTTTPEDLAAWPLLVERREGRGVCRRVERVLVLTTDLEEVCATRLAEVDRICADAAVDQAVLSDGLRWRAHFEQSRRTRSIRDLCRDVADPGALEMTLTDLAEGV